MGFYWPTIVFFIYRSQFIHYEVNEIQCHRKYVIIDEVIQSLVIPIQIGVVTRII